MHAHLWKGACHAVATNYDVIVVKLLARLPKPVEVRFSREPLGLQLYAHDQRRRVDQRAQTAAGGCVLGDRGDDLRGLDARINSAVLTVARRSYSQRQRARVIGAKTEPANDVSLAKRVLDCVEVEIAVLRGARFGGVDSERQG